MIVYSILALLIVQSRAQTVRWPSVELVDGFKIPIIGLGTYQLSDNQEVMDRVVNDAIDAGYRAIDTAYIYQNEALIGKSLKKMFDSNKINRTDLFITSKVWSTYHKRSAVVEALKLSLNNLGLDYLDLALVHWPLALRPGTGYLWPLNDNNQTMDVNISVVETWKGMQDAHRLGLAKSIGVSNFNSDQLTRVLNQGYMKPVMNQVETHPYNSQEKLVDFCHQHNIQVTAYCPMGKADKQLLNETILLDLADKYNKTVPQVMLRWLIQRDIIAIPKTSRKERLIENINIFDFQIDDEDMKKIFSINKNKRFIDPKESRNNPEYPFSIPF